MGYPEVFLAFRIDRKIRRASSSPEIRRGICALPEARGASSQRRSKERPPDRATDAETLNFKVTTEFKREFKGYAVSQGVTMVELLKEGFELSKRERKQ